MTVTTIASLPKEILLVIFDYLEDSRVCNYVCKEWKKTGEILQQSYVKKLKDVWQWDNYNAMRMGHIHMADDLWAMYACKNCPATPREVFRDWRKYKLKKSLRNY